MDTAAVDLSQDVRGSKKTELAGWGRHRVSGEEIRSEDLSRATEGAVLSRGLGRSYGDASLPPADQPRAVNTTLADRILGFDDESGLLHAEAGLSLAEMNRIFLPRLWFTPVTPGTQYVTLGGMVASDVHGKNHHLDGCIGEHVTRLLMRVADGRVLWCSRNEHEDLFRATLGGMGLTGHILEVELRMRRIPSQWIYSESTRIDDIDSFQSALEDAATRWPFTVGWIDCVTRGRYMGRGILICGRWAEPDEAPDRSHRQLPKPRVPFDTPSWLLNPLTMRLFNEVYYRAHVRRVRCGIVDPFSFFYPLDIIRDWNRLYGPRGFTQYQCVLPREAGRDSARRILEELTQRGGGSFLSVIKDFGAEGLGTLSFPRPGITLALDLPINDDTQSVVDALNQQVIADGGRIYLTKDSFTRAADFRQMEPRLAEFTAIRDRWDPERKFRSAQSVRVLGD